MLKQLSPDSKKKQAQRAAAPRLQHETAVNETKQFLNESVNFHNQLKWHNGRRAQCITALLHQTARIRISFLIVVERFITQTYRVWTSTPWEEAASGQQQQPSPTPCLSSSSGKSHVWLEWREERLLFSPKAVPPKEQFKSCWNAAWTENSRLLRPSLPTSLPAATPNEAGLLQSHTRPSHASLKAGYELRVVEAQIKPLTSGENEHGC